MPENEEVAAAPAPETSASSSNNGGDDGPATETAAAQTVSTEEITYHAVEKEGQVSAIWEMQGRKHLRTIDPRSRQGQEILRLYTSEHADETAGGGGGPQEGAENAATSGGSAQ